MTILQIAFLACWAVLDLALVIWSPTRMWAVTVQGLEKDAVKQQWVQPGYIGNGCNLAMGNFLELLVTLVVEPAYLIWALRAHVGSPQFVLAMLTILTANFVTSSICGWKERKNKTFPLITRKRWLWMWFCTIPTCSLWYLLVVCFLAH